MHRVAAGRRRRTALVLIAALAAAAVAPAAAGPQDRLRRNEEKLERIDRRQAALNAREGTALDRLAVIDGRRAEAEENLARLDSRLSRLDVDIRETRDELAIAQHRLALISDDLLDIQGRLVARTELFSERAVAAYISGPSAYLDGLFESATFSEALDWSRYQEIALDSDSELIEEIEVLRDETEVRRELVELKRGEIAREKLKLERSRATIASLRAEKAEVLAAREAATVAKQAVVADIRANQAKLQRAEAQLQRDSASIEALLSGSSSGVPAGGGQLRWPANGPVTSPFGYRTHPIFGDTRLHSGIDIGAPYGSAVIAADGGTVVFAGVMSGYGNAIVVDHGGGLATTYNHLSSYGVSDGQRVGRGQYIAAVGCTGYCTGPHLHFEVRVNGTPVDPMPYLR